MSKIELRKENVTAAYSVADSNLFGDVVKRPVPTLDDYATIQEYEDACIALGEDPINETELEKTGVPSHIIALMKLETISRALWGRDFQPKPDAEGKSIYWWVWCVLYTQAEIDNMREEERGALLAVYATRGAAAGFGGLNTTYRSSYSAANCGFRLCQETDEKAQYFGRKFIRLWAEYLAFNFTIEED